MTYNLLNQNLIIMVRAGINLTSTQLVYNIISTMEMLQLEKCVRTK